MMSILTPCSPYAFAFKWRDRWLWDCPRIWKHYSSPPPVIEDEIRVTDIKFSERMPHGFVKARLGGVLLVIGYSWIDKRYRLVVYYAHVMDLVLFHTYSIFMPTGHIYILNPVVVLPQVTAILTPLLLRRRIDKIAWFGLALAGIITVLS